MCRHTAACSSNFLSFQLRQWVTVAVFCKAVASHLNLPLQKLVLAATTHQWHVWNRFHQIMSHYMSLAILASIVMLRKNLLMPKISSLYNNSPLRTRTNTIYKDLCYLIGTDYTQIVLMFLNWCVHSCSNYITITLHISQAPTQPLLTLCYTRCNTFGNRLYKSRQKLISTHNTLSWTQTSCPLQPQ